MIGNISAEILVLRRRAAVWILLGIWLVLGGFFAYLLPYITYLNGGEAGLGESLTDLLPQSLVSAISGGFPFFGGAIALILAVMTMGGEFGWDTWKTLFTQGPGRMRVFTAKLIALGLALVPFAVLVFAVGALGSYIIAQREGAPLDWPGAWLIIKAMLGGWLILAVWAALGVLFAVLTRGMALAMGIGILYALVVEGLVILFATQVSVFEPAVEFFLRANAYSLVAGVGASVEGAADNGPGSFSGPFVSGEQALLVLVAYVAGFLLLSAWLLRRRDVA
jgi:ABC-2 type transport system permease protein